MRSIHWPLALVFAFACGSDGGGGGGGGTLSTSINANKDIEDLTVQEAQELCEDFAEFALSSFDTVCLALAIIGSANPAECTAESADCQLPFTGTLDASAQCSGVDQGDIDEAQGCGVTVGDYIDCSNASISAMRAIAGLGCSAAGDPSAFSSVGSAGNELASPKCENAFDCDWSPTGSSSGSSGGGGPGNCDFSDPCYSDDPCDFADDNFCDCPSQAWDAADCS